MSQLSPALRSLSAAKSTSLCSINTQQLTRNTIGAVQTHAYTQTEQRQRRQQSRLPGRADLRLFTTTVDKSAPYVPEFTRQIDHSGKDIIQIIKDEHRMAEELYSRFQQTSNRQDKQIYAYNLIKLLSQHAACEEMVLYPIVKQRFTNGEQLNTRNLADHQQLKQLLSRVDEINVNDAVFDDFVHQALQKFIEHEKEEEKDKLPQLAQVCSIAELKAFGEQFESLKRIAPTRPHPDAPNEPPANKVTNAAAAALDAAKDTVRFRGLTMPDTEKPPERERVKTTTGTGTEAGQRTDPTPTQAASKGSTASETGKTPTE